jgi:soluble lytic murein transglycosylase-like protein
MYVTHPKLTAAAKPTLHTLAKTAAREVGLKPRLVEAVIYVETNGQPDPSVAVSYAGAIGPMQLEPATAKYLHVDPWNPAQNILGGSEYLKRLLHKFGGSLWLALEAYNQGPTAVMEGRTCPAAIAYAGAVIRRMRAY